MVIKNTRRAADIRTISRLPDAHNHARRCSFARVRCDRRRTGGPTVTGGLSRADAGGRDPVCRDRLLADRCGHAVAAVRTSSNFKTVILPHSGTSSTGATSQKAQIPLAGSPGECVFAGARAAVMMTRWKIVVATRQRRHYRVRRSCHHTPRRVTKRPPAEFFSPRFVGAHPQQRPVIHRSSVT